ncbi:MAG: hypothetical protein MJE77_03905 [Proteobacteria bacterium]|nr:hypothetical protein [Pseudomonadota bacterium]
MKPITSTSFFCSAILLASAVLSPALARAQSQPQSPSSDQPDDDDRVELEPDDDYTPNRNQLDIPRGAAENPDELPEFGQTRRGQTGARAIAMTRTDYPRELVHRPIVLAPGMSQITLDVLADADDVFVTGLLQARYGVNQDIQLGLGYAPGAVGRDGFTSGKAVSIDVHYAIASWIAIQLELPFLLDPFAMGVTVGAPVKFRAGQKLAFIAGRDLFNARIERLFPDIGDPIGNAELVRQNRVNTALPAGELRFLGGVIYQINPELAVLGEIGILAKDFGLNNAGVPLLATVTYSSATNLDVGARIGFRDLSQDSGGFGATVVVAVRL